VYVASSLDGFIAGPDGDLSWLPAFPEGSDEDFGWGAFMEDIGCLLMGRGTYDAIDAMGIEWPHSDRETLVATRRPLDDMPNRVEVVRGRIEELVERASEKAGGQDVYVDGGDLIRQALDSGLVEEITVTLCPVVLGAGYPLFAGVEHRHVLTLRSQRPLPGGLVQLTYTME